MALGVPQIGHAQFGLFRDISRGAQADATDAKCKSGKKTRGGLIVGNVLGGVASRTAGRSAVGSYLPVAKFSDTITDVIACKLDEQEQEKAALATTDAVHKAERASGPQTVAWESDTRSNVTGTSTVDTRTKLADGTSCMNVTDVVIIEGEETRVQKKMCRSPGQSRYVLTA
jgi:surface antigen